MAYPNRISPEVVVLCWLCAVGLAGCSKHDQIRHYKVDKQHVLYQTNHTDSPAARSVPGHSGTLPAEQPSRQLTYDAPQQWTPGQLVASRGSITVRYQAAFEVVDGAKKVEITVSQFPAAAANPLMHINRWRRQIQLDAVTQEQLDKQIKKIQVNQASGDYIQLIGPPEAERPQTTLGAIVVDGPRAWFFKLKGDSELAQREKQRFEAFLQSVRFSGP